MIKFKLSKEEYEELLEMVFIGSLIKNSTDQIIDPESFKKDMPFKVYQRLLEQARQKGLGHLVQVRPSDSLLAFEKSDILIAKYVPYLFDDE